VSDDNLTQDRLNLDKFKSDFQNLLSDNKTSPEITLEKISLNKTLIKNIKDLKPELTNNISSNNSAVQELRQQNLTQVDQTNDVLNQIQGQTKRSN
jgi:hypothetical protein